MLPGSGVLELGIPIGELGAGVEGAALCLQGSFLDTVELSMRLGGGSLAVLLDPSL